jgi:hypothetical protein
MRGEDRESGGLFSYVDLEARVPADHPLRPIRTIVDEALSALSGEFAPLYSHLGRPWIPPERLLRDDLLGSWAAPKRPSTLLTAPSLGAAAETQRRPIRLRSLLSV